MADGGIGEAALASTLLESGGAAAAGAEIGAGILPLLDMSGVTTAGLNAVAPAALESTVASSIPANIFANPNYTQFAQMLTQSAPDVAAKGIAALTASMPETMASTAIQGAGVPGIPTDIFANPNYAQYLSSAAQAAPEAATQIASQVAQSVPGVPTDIFSNPDYSQYLPPGTPGTPADTTANLTRSLASQTTAAVPAAPTGDFMNTPEPGWTSALGPKRDDRTPFFSGVKETLGDIGDFVKENKLLTGAGLAGLAMYSDRNKYGMPTPEKYTGPLSKFRYDPSTYQPYVYRPYAGGGPVEAMSNANAVGANTGYPMADIARGAYATPYQQPISQNVLSGAQDTRVDPYTGQERFAGGGIADLGGYSDGGRLLRGPGDGVSDSIPAMIGQKQPARLADGEFVVPARIVSELGNGSTDAGARELYKMMERVQSARGKTVGKGRVAKDSKAAKHLPA